MYVLVRVFGSLVYVYNRRPVGSSIEKRIGFMATDLQECVSDAFFHSSGGEKFPFSISLFLISS